MRAAIGAGPLRWGNMADRQAGAGRKGCFKSGCFGCLGVTGFLVIVAGGIALLALLMGPPPQEFVDPGIVRTLPVQAGEAGSIEPDRGAELPQGDFRPRSAVPGRIVLDLSGGVRRPHDFGRLGLAQSRFIGAGFGGDRRQAERRL